MPRRTSTESMHLVSQRMAIEMAPRTNFARGVRQPTLNSDQLREANMQLVDALDRLVSAEKRLQEQFRSPYPTEQDE